MDVSRKTGKEVEHYGKGTADLQGILFAETVVDRWSVLMPGGGDVLLGQLPRSVRRLRHGQTAPHLLRPARSETGVHQLRRRLG